MDVQRIINQPQKQAKAYLQERVNAWKKFDNDHKLAIDEAMHMDQVKISGKDGSVLYGKERNMGHHGTFFTELIEHSDGSASLYSAKSDFSYAQSVKKNVDGSYEGLEFRAEAPEEPPATEAPPSVLAIFTDYAPAREVEPSVRASPIEAAKAEDLFTSTKRGIDEWEFFLADDPLEYRRESLEYHRASDR